MSTIVGNNKRSPGRSTFLLQVRYNAADAKLALQQYLTENPLFAKTPLTKELVMEIFYKNPLGYLPRKSMKSLCEFLFSQALKNGYIVVVPPVWVGDQTEYVVAPTILEKRPGPKKVK